MNPIVYVVTFCAILLMGQPAPSWAQSFSTHQDWISALEDEDKFDIEDPHSVLSYVLQQFNNPIRVQPTENYAYFKFIHRGLPFQGNIRIENENGKPEVLHFAYFIVPAPWHQSQLGHYQTFSKEDGLSITQKDRHHYFVAFGGINREFILNDISKIEPPTELLLESEIFLGQVNDESGLRFWLIFDVIAQEFAYFLDTSTPFSERLEASSHYSVLQVGLRTGFVFIKDPQKNRLRLVGVYEDNITRNTYYDGPFDQLPDGYKGKISIGDAFIAIDPELKNEIDQFGNFINQEGTRAVIAPYLRYWQLSDFEPILACHNERPIPIHYSICLRVAMESVAK